MSNTWHKRKENRKVTFRMGENETEIDFVLVKKKIPTVYLKCEGNIWLMITDIDKRKIRILERKACAERYEDQEEILRKK